MTLYVVLILLVAWGWWGIATLRDRRQTVGRGSNSIVEFNDRLSVLERTGPSWQGVPAAPVAPLASERLSVVPPATPVGPGAPGGLTAPRDRWATGFQDRQRPAARQLRDLISGTPLESVTQRVLPSGRPMTLTQAQARRRQMMVGLLAAVVVTGLLGLLAGGFLAALFVLTLLATVAYLALLVRARAEQIERAIKVRSIGRQERSGAAYGAVAYGAEDDAEDWVGVEAVGGGSYAASYGVAEAYGTGSLGSTAAGADAAGAGSYGADVYA